MIAMGSSLVAAVWGDALALVLMRMSDHSWGQVLADHPSGAVGQLQLVPGGLPRLPTGGLDSGPDLGLGAPASARQPTRTSAPDRSPSPTATATVPGNVAATTEEC